MRNKAPNYGLRILLFLLGVAALTIFCTCHFKLYLYCQNCFTVGKVQFLLSLVAFFFFVRYKRRRGFFNPNSKIC
jgi:hypothetical protein